MIKKCLAWCLALVLTMTPFTAMARLVTETVKTADQWSFVYTGSADKSNCISELEEVTVRTGSYALKMGCGLATTGAGNIVARYPLSGLPNGTYELSFYVSGVFTTGSVYAGVVDSFGINNTLARFTKTTDTQHAGWTRYTTSVTYSGEGYLKFQFVKGCDVIYLDDITLTKDGNNRIVNGGFEETITTTSVVVVTDPPSQNPSQSGLTVVKDAYMPTGVLVWHEGTNTASSWINPTAISLQNVALYELVNGRENLLTSGLDTGSGVSVEYLQEDTAYTIHQYKIVFTFSDGTMTEYLYDSEITPKRQIPNWTLTYHTGSDGNVKTYLPMAVWTDRTQKHGAEAAFKVVSNAAKTKDGSVVLSQNIDLKANTTYVLYIWRKAVNASPYVITYGGNPCKVNPTQKENSDWECLTYQIQFSEKSNSLLEIAFEKNIEALWLDDIEIYQFSNGNPTGQNLVVNGGFETGVTLEHVLGVSNLTAVNEQNAASLSWINPAGGFETISVYRKSGNGFVPCGQFGASVNSIRLTNLKESVAYPIAVALNGSHLQDSPVATAAIIPLGPEMVLGAVQVTRQGTQYQIKQTITNERLTDGYDAELIVAVFEDDVMTKAVSGGRCHITEGETQTLLVELNLPHKPNCHLEIFTWDTLFGLRVRTPYTTYVIPAN